MKIKRLSFMFLLILLALFVSFTLKTYAADKTNISISPLIFDLSTNPGDSTTNELLIRNSGKEPMMISVEAQDFVAKGEEGDISLTEKSTYSLASWVQTDSQKFVLDGGQNKRVKFIIRVPYNAEPGGHYASVYAHISPTLNNAQSGTGIGQKIGALVLLKVAGPVKENAIVETFKTTKGNYSKGPVDFDIRIKNTGSVHLKPKGVIAITNIFGKKVADVQTEQKNVLPGAIRHMKSEWKNTPRFGKYTATLLSYYGTDNKQLTAATTFWIIPWKTILIWAIIVLVFIVLIYFGRDRIKNASKALIKKK